MNDLVEKAALPSLFQWAIGVIAERRRLAYLVHRNGCASLGPTLMLCDCDEPDRQRMALDALQATLAHLNTNRDEVALRMLVSQFRNEEGYIRLTFTAEEIANSVPIPDPTYGGVTFTGCRVSTAHVLQDVALERQAQVARYGDNADLLDGTGPGVGWIPLRVDGWLSAEMIERRFRIDYEAHEAEHGKPTWMHLVREEIAESFKEADPERLRAELIQVAALCVSWVEKLDAR